eukprot:12915626-Prorocentrum_lima.AAC.1
MVGINGQRHRVTGFQRRVSESEARWKDPIENKGTSVSLMEEHGHNFPSSSCGHLAGRVRDPPRKFVIKNPEEPKSTAYHSALKTEQPSPQACTMNYANT